jgi:hypothetical protein
LKNVTVREEREKWREDEFQLLWRIWHKEREREMEGGV